MQYELLTQKLNKMDKEKILLDALNTFGNFTSVEQEFNYNQLEVIYEAMNQVLHIAPVVWQSEQFISLIRELIDVGIIDEDDIEVETWVNNYLKEIN